MTEHEIDELAAAVAAELRAERARSRDTSSHDVEPPPPSSDGAPLSKPRD